jgi:peptide deformylase
MLLTAEINKSYMAIIKILQYPDKRLKRIAVPVETFDETLHRVIDDMFETRYNTPSCAALAATQLDLDPAWRITVIDLSPDDSEPLYLVNPTVIHREGEQFEYEGCMSVFPKQLHEKVKRAMKVTVKAQDKYGKPFEITAEGYLAKCLQHEIDHLDGHVYLDRLPLIKQERMQRKIKKILRQ